MANQLSPETLRIDMDDNIKNIFSGMKEDERLLLKTMIERTTENSSPYIMSLIEELGINRKRAAYIFEKWAARGWYDYGVSSFGGWLTDEGLNHAIR